MRKQLSELGLSDFEVVPVTTKSTKDGIVPIDSDKDPTVLQVVHPCIVESETGFDYVEPIVKVEISCLSLSEPFAARPIQSFIYQKFPNEDDECVCTINTVSPERTFLEKAFLLNEEFQKTKPRTRRMSRHYYDLEKLMDTEFGWKALQDHELYNRIIDHRRQFNKLHFVDYEQDRSENIRFYPPQELINAFRADYASMVSAFIFKEAPGFDELMRRIAELQERFRQDQRPTA